MVRLIVGDGARTIRREVGMTSWAVLEELATIDSGGTTNHVTASVRGIADALGISKNAAHRAIRRLADANLVTPVQTRSTDGRFLAGTYRLTVPTDALHLATDEPNPNARASIRTNRATRRHHIDDTTQLSLLAP